MGTAVRGRNLKPADPSPTSERDERPYARSLHFKIQSREDIYFKVLPHQVNGNFKDRPSLADAGVVHQNVELNLERVFNNIRVPQIEFLDS